MIVISGKVLNISFTGWVFLCLALFLTSLEDLT